MVAPTATFDWKELTPVAAHPAPAEFPVGRVDAGRADRDPDLADSSLETQRRRRATTSAFQSLSRFSFRSITGDSAPRPAVGLTEVERQPAIPAIRSPADRLTNKTTEAVGPIVGGAANGRRWRPVAVGPHCFGCSRCSEQIVRQM